MDPDFWFNERYDALSKLLTTRRIVVRITEQQITSMSQGESDRATTALAALARLSDTSSADQTWPDISSWAFTFVPTRKIEAHIEVLAPYLTEPYTPMIPPEVPEPAPAHTEQIRVRTVEI